jgi:hypothetical protein
VFDVRGAQKDKHVTDKVMRLLHQYVPEVLVMQDTSPEGTPRANRLALLNSELVAWRESSVCQSSLIRETKYTEDSNR